MHYTSADINHLLFLQEHVLRVLPCKAEQKDTSRLICNFGNENFQIRCLKQLVVKNMIEEIKSDCDKDIPGLSSNSDLISGHYEGGFKVWESTKDLLQLLTVDTSVIQGKDVLDLGCGSGLLGIACLLSGARSVTFHDYNPDVVKYFTLGNVLMNLQFNDTALGLTDVNQLQEFVNIRVKVCSGDWRDFHPQDSFDVILSSETIYNQDYYGSLLRVIQDSLKQDNCSHALIAAKTYYFGVGGGTRSFEDFVCKQTSLTSSVIKVIPESVQREILQLKRKSK